MKSPLTKRMVFFLAMMIVVLPVTAAKSSAQLFACFEADPLAVKSDYEARLKADPNDYWAYAQRGWALFQQKKPDEALQNINHAIELKPGDSVLLVARGRIYFYQDKDREALDDFTVALEIDPKNHYALYRRAQIYIQLRNFAVAMDDLEHLIDVKPNLAEGYDELGRVLALNGDEQAAQRIRAKVLSTLNKQINDPENKCRLDLTYARGKFQMNTGNARTAIEDLNVVIKAVPTHFLPFYVRGLSYLDAQSFDDAIKDFTKSIEIQPHWAANYRFRAIAYRETKQIKLAEADEQHYRQLSDETNSPDKEP